MSAQIHERILRQRNRPAQRAVLHYSPIWRSHRFESLNLLGNLPAQFRKNLLPGPVLRKMG
jgi:hypothetical protein